MPETLANDIRVLSGWAFPSAGFDTQEGVPLIRIRDLGRSVTEVKYRGKFESRYLIADGDVLIGMDGDFVVQKWSGGPALLNQRVCKVEAASSSLDQGFLYWYLIPQVAEIHRKTPQTTVRHLSAAALLEIISPPIDVIEQRFVGQVLDTLDIAIHRTEAIIEKLKQVKQGLLHDLLTRGIDDNGELRPPQSEAPHLYKQSELGWIPLDWCVRSLAEVGQSVTGSTPPSSVAGVWGPGLPFMTPAEVAEGGPIADAERHVSDRGRRYARVLPPESTLVVCIGSTIGKVGMTAVEACSNQQINAFIPGAAVVPGFAHVAVRMQIGQLRAMAGLQAVPIVNKASFEKMRVPVPPHAEQLDIAARLQSANCLVSHEEHFAEKLRITKVGLMDDLLTGRVRVTPLLGTSPS